MQWWKHLFGGALSILIAQSAGFLGAVFTFDAIPTWYSTLAKPFFSPPNWIFGPVWTLLYALMGIAAYLVWLQRKSPEGKRALWFYGVQLFANALWSVLFFGVRSPMFAFIEILVLLCLIIVTTVLFWRKNIWSGVLMVPYILWVSFATVLNATIWFLN